MFSQIKDIRRIEQNFYSVAWVMHRGLDLRVGGGCQKLDVSEHCHVAYQIKGDDV